MRTQSSCLHAPPLQKAGARRQPRGPAASPALTYHRRHRLLHFNEPCGAQDGVAGQQLVALCAGAGRQPQAQAGARLCCQLPALLALLAGQHVGGDKRRGAAHSCRRVGGSQVGR